jgi:methionyl-tRNA formyltransferase
VNSADGQALLQSLEPDLILLAGAPILTASTISRAKVACLNAHCGITPDYCGSSPAIWAIAEERHDLVGYTVHLVVPVLDAGPIIHQAAVRWDGRRLRDLWPLLAAPMYEDLVHVTKRLVRGDQIRLTDLRRPPRVRPPAGLVTRVNARLRSWLRPGGVVPRPSES